MRKKYFDTAAFGREVKQDRLKEHIPRKYVANIEHISPRHLMAIENKGQPPSLNLMGSLCRRFDISADQFIFPKDHSHKDALRRHISHELDEIEDKDLPIVESTISGIRKSEKR